MQGFARVGEAWQGPLAVERRHVVFARIFLLLLALLAPARAFGQAAAGDPELLWRTVETEHFRITYHEPLGAVAQKLAAVTERAHKMLSPLLAHSPRFRTEVLIADDTDYSNGSAGVVPFPTVNLLLTGPDDRNELNDYDDWLLALFMHEYTHILHLDTINGLPKWANYLLGLGINNFYPPNQLQYNWFIEGLAVFEETERTSAGRLRSSIYDMWLRAQVLEGKFRRFDQLSRYSKPFPQGNVPYLYGSAFLRYIARRFGAELLTKVSQRYAGCWSPDCWVPWGMNRALRRYTGGIGYDALYKDFHRDLEQRYHAQFQTLLRSPLALTPEQALTEWKLAVDRPVLSRDGQEVLWLESDPGRRPALMRLDRRSGKTRVELEVDGASGLTLDGSGKFALFSRHQVIPPPWGGGIDGGQRNELTLYRRDRHSLTRLSERLRVDTPVISPDGRLVAFAVNSGGTRRLAIMELPDTAAPGSERRINPRAVAVPEIWRARAAAPVRFPLPQKPYSQVYTPAWSPDGRQLAFSYWQEGGYRDIVLLDLPTGRLTYVTHDRSLDLEPSYSPDGEYLYFVSDRSGIFNVYAYHLKTGTTWQATNVVNGLFSPAVTADGTKLYCVGFVAEGYRMEVLPLDPGRFILAPASISERPEAPAVSEPAVPLPVQHYRPARSFFRSALSLLSLQVPTSAPGPYGQAFGFSFATADLVGLHNLSLSLTINSARPETTGFLAAYTYSRLWNSLTLSVRRLVSPERGLRINGQNYIYDEEQWSAALSTILPVLREPVRVADIQVSYQFANTRSLQPFPTSGIDPQTSQFPELGRFASLELDFLYSDARSYLYSIVPEAGRTVSAQVFVAHPAIGSQYFAYALNVAVTQYVGIPWPWRFAKNHVMSFTYAGSIGGGDLQHRGYFSLGGFLPLGGLPGSILPWLNGSYNGLRGYPYASLYGNQAHLLSVEYRFPIWWMERGYDTLPIYLQKLHGAIYSDAGTAFFDKPTLAAIKASLGAELLLSGTLADAFFPFTLHLGYVYGFMSGANGGVYFLLDSHL